MIRSDFLEQGFIDLLFLNTDLATVGDASGLQASSAAGSLYAALHTAWPGENGNQSTNECAYTGYARPAMARSGSGFTRTGSRVENAAAISFGQKTGGSDEVALFASLGVGSSGTTSLLFSFPLGTVLGPCASDDTAGDNVLIPGHGLSVDNRVVFFAGLGASLPTGITEGTVYFVKTVTDANNVILSTTSGGSAVNITGVGAGVAYKVTPISITDLSTPQFAAGDLTIDVY